MLQWVEKVLTDGQWWENIGLIALKILIILIFAQLIIRISNIAFKKIVSRDYNGSFMSDERRIKTLSTLFNNVIKYVVHFVTIMLVLAQMNFDLAPLIASAGVLGLAIGFGAQNLVKDVVNGFFIIFEDQFAVGDQVTIGNFSGTVVQIGLRITKIKSYTGEIHIITNGALS